MGKLFFFTPPKGSTYFPTSFTSPTEPLLVPKRGGMAGRVKDLFHYSVSIIRCSAILNELRLTGRTLARVLSIERTCQWVLKIFSTSLNWEWKEDMKAHSCSVFLTTEAPSFKHSSLGTILISSTTASKCFLFYTPFPKICLSTHQIV